ncbi:MAG: DUF4398 domain-containing protein, partial [Blastocatellia bacterium]
MTLRKLVFPITLLVMAAGVVSATQAPQRNDAAGWALAKRITLAVKYPENTGSTVDMIGTGLHSNVTGRVEAKHVDGRTRIKLRINNLEHPQTLGSYFTSYIMWAITPEGMADNLGNLRELPPAGSRSREIEINIPHQTFGLIITAEPHSLVRYPGPMIIAENFLRKDTRGNGAASNIEYRGDPGTFYILSGVTDAAATADYNTPLDVLGARRAVEIARRAGAAHYASEELGAAERKLAEMERIWAENHKKTMKFSGEAREAMRLAEVARAKAIEQMKRTRLEAKPGAAARAQFEGDQVRNKRQAASDGGLR